MPWPVTTPSPGIFCSSMPKSCERCSTNMSHSSKEPGSNSSSRRSRAVSLPLACCCAMRRSPPPARAAARFSSSCRRMSFMAAGDIISGLRAPASCAASRARKRALARDVVAAAAARRCVCSASSPHCSISKLSSSCGRGEGRRGVESPLDQRQRHHQRAARRRRQVERRQRQGIVGPDRRLDARQGRRRLATRHDALGHRERRVVAHLAQSTSGCHAACWRSTSSGGCSGAIADQVGVGVFHDAPRPPPRAAARRDRSRCWRGASAAWSRDRPCSPCACHSAAIASASARLGTASGAFAGVRIGLPSSVDAEMAARRDDAGRRDKSASAP